MKSFPNVTRAGVSLLILGSLSLLPSCKLNEAPYSTYDTASFYATAGGAEAGLVGSYGALNSLYWGPAAVWASDWSADQTYPRPVVSRNVLTLFTYDATYSQQVSAGRAIESPVYIWQYCYVGIEKANQVLDRVPLAVMDESRKKVILAEARYLRAFYYWMLTKNFGDVVIKTTGTNSQADAFTAKSPRLDVYKQIYADLDVAVAGLPSGPGGIRKGSPSKEAALALYAKAALYGGDNALALSKATLVLANKGYFLLPNVYDVYDVANEDAARVENLWAFEGEAFTNSTASPASYSYLNVLYGPANSAGRDYGFYSFGSAFAYQSFYDSFSPTDRRRTLLATSYVDRMSGATVPQASISPITTQAVLVRKYQDPKSVAGFGYNNCNVPILRLADVYLIAAEAEARASGPGAAAYANINAVRTRAGLPNLTPGLSQADFIDAVLQERSWELFAEGDRWYDLTRTDKFLTVVPKAVNNVYPTRTPQARNKYFPIPQDEINANPLITQNTGW